MRADLWPKVEALYHAALEQPAERRAAYLALAGAGDPELLTEVQSLLDQQTEAFLEGSPVGMHVGLEVGARLAHFEILAPLGQGGMGTVYRARDTRLEREVAIKVVAERFSARFEQEARAIAALNHPHICSLYDIGPDYLVMEYIEGETLTARVARGPLPLSEALPIAIAGALGAAHGKGIIHRDLKPGNIMLGKAGVKLLDFGLAQFKHPASAEGQMETKRLTGEAGVIGTLPYMAPEQFRGEEADARSDVFAFGAVLYGMLTGCRTFDRNSAVAIVAAVTSEEPKSIREFVPRLPLELEGIVRRCLNKNAEDRYGSLAKVEQALRACLAQTAEPVSGINLKVLLRQSRRPRVAIPALLAVAALASLAVVWWQHQSKVRWAREEALPRIARLVDEGKEAEAYALAVSAERHIGGDPMLAKLWPKIAWDIAVTTTPPGAAILRREYAAPGGAWERLGTTPMAKRRTAPVEAVYRIELPGYARVERAVFSTNELTMNLVPDTVAPEGMVQVSAQPAEPKLMGIAGLEGVSHLALSDYWIDRYEVTNRQYKKFLAAGGYRRPEFWKEKFRQDGRALAWVEAMALLRDSTGQPGPATWVQGDYPAGQDDFPVTGVSWYEAAAYAGFAGRQLPTFQHWFAAAAPTDSAAIIPASNFGGQAVARVGQYGGMSWCGTYDMAGNVKEWCRNEDRVGRRMIMGGGWNEPEYMFNDADARAPFERKANFGFRCARYETSGDAEQAERPITLSARDFRREKPVAEPLFRVYKSFYAYDKTPLKAVVEKTEESAEWRREETSFAAAYGSERVLVILLLPKHGQPPYQTVVYHPTADAIRNRNGPSQRLTSFLEFLIRSGRAVAMPVYKGTYARGDGLEYAYPNTSNNYRDHVIAWSKDLGRTIDYLETRPDIASGKLAFMGVSWGGAMGLLLPALEPRIKACVLVVPGFYLQRSLPEVDQLNFAPRVTAPVLMLSGRFDFLFPVGLSQLPAFDILGTPKENKRRVVYEMDHALPPRNELIKETLGWLDRYLGPVN